MDETRRRLVTAGFGIGLGATTGLAATNAAAAVPVNDTTMGVPATAFGIVPDSGRDETARFAEAIGVASEKHLPLLFPAGHYNIEGLSATGKYIHLIGIPGATTFNGKGRLFEFKRSPMVRFEGIQFEGGGERSDGDTALVSVDGGICTAIDCTYRNGGHGLVLSNVSGHTTRCYFHQLTGNGVTASDCQHLSLDDNRFSELHKSAIETDNSSNLIITANSIDRVSGGICVSGTTEKHGRLAAISGNIIANIDSSDGTKFPGIGIYAERDAAINGNIVENAATVGIRIGQGERQRDINCSSNVVRNCSIGIGVSGDFKTGYVVIALNMISGSVSGAIRAMDQNQPLGPDLAHESAESYRTLAIFGNVAPR